MVRESDRQIDKWIDIQITRKKEKREKENDRCINCRARVGRRQRDKIARVKWLFSPLPSSPESGPSHLWLGASDLETEGTFRWLSGDLVTSGWRENQPDDAEGDEDCLEMWTAKFPSLSDKQCHLNSAFICQCM